MSDRPDFHCTDLGNARRLVARHGHDLRYAYEWQQWLVWDGARWAPDRTGEVQRRAKETVLSIYEEAATSDEKTKRRELAQHATRSESEGRIAAMVSLARSEPSIPVLAESLDRDPWSFNVLNGTLNLRTGALEPPQREDLLTKVAPVSWDPDAACPTWNAFLRRVLNGDQELIAFLQRALGYTMTGLTVEQVLLLLYGLGGNGKTVFLQLVLRLFGEYGAKADFAAFLAGRRDGPRNDLAALMGARYVAASEVGEGQRFDESIVKALTGGDTVTARKLYADLFSFQPSFTIWLAANTKPQVRSTGEAIWRRMRLVPFTVIVPAEERDPHLLDRLTGELPGILTWAVAGCLAWQQAGLGQPPAVEEATAAYRGEMDVLAGFLEQECTFSANTRTGSSWLFKAYKEWAIRNEERLLSQTAFSLRLVDRGYHRVKDSAGRMQWIGIGLNGGPEGYGGPSVISPREKNSREEYRNGGSKDPNPPFLALTDEEIERQAIASEAIA